MEEPIRNADSSMTKRAQTGPLSATLKADKSHRGKQSRPGSIEIFIPERGPGVDEEWGREYKTFQAAQFIEVSSPSTRGMVALKDIKKEETLTLNVVHVSGAGQPSAGRMGMASG